MEAALRWQKLINLLSGFACIDDAERLILLSQFHGKFCISHVAAVAECHTAEAVIESYSIGTNLLYFYLRAERANQIVQSFFAVMNSRVNLKRQIIKTEAAGNSLFFVSDLQLEYILV